MKYYIDHEILNQKLELKTLIENILSHAQIIRVGAGRANGFEHITIKINQEPKTKQIKNNRPSNLELSLSPSLICDWLKPKRPDSTVKLKYKML